MRDGMSKIGLHSSTRKVGSPDSVVYLHRSGNVIGPYQNVSRSSEFDAGFASIATRKRTARGQEWDSVYLLDMSGSKLVFQVDDGYTPLEIFHLDRSLYYLTEWNWSINNGRSRIYDASTRKFVFEPKDDVMGVKWTLISLHDSNTKRYYVIDYLTGAVVYDTHASQMAWSDLNAALSQAGDIRRFQCNDDDDLSRLTELKELRELTLYGLNAVTLPASFYFEHLEVLRIDGLMQLTAFPAHLKGLRKIALRDCVKASNLMELLNEQHELEELYLINFGLSETQRQQIKSMFPQARIVIEGKIEHAFSDLQIVIEGF
jgi:hypothetical protein